MRSILALVSLFIFSCSGGSGGGDTSGNVSASVNLCNSSPLLGTWKGTAAGTADILTISANCQITSSACQSNSTMSPSTASTGMINITVGASNGKTGCFPPGTFTCAYSVTANALSYNCGGGIISYSK